MAKKQKGPKVKSTPTAPDSIRVVVDPNAWKADQARFHFSGFDIDSEWGKGALISCDWRDFLIKIEHFSTMTWAEILKAAGSVRSGTNNHEIEINRLSKKAKDRLKELAHDTDTVFSLHMTGSLRLYGIRDRSVCKALWVDPWHGDPNRAVCPSSKRHT
ncbi:MAG: hypothetical protein U1E66_12075 [Rhodospirillales bacterium]